MSWTQGIDDEVEMSKRVQAESPVSVSIDVPRGISITACIEQVSATGGKRLRVNLDTPDMNPARD